MSRIHLEVDDELDRAHPAKWGAAVEIETRSGRSCSGRTDFPRGDPKPVDDDLLVSKFRLLALESWGEEG